MKKALLTLILSFTFGVNSFAAWDPTKPVYDEYIYDDLIAIRANWDAIALGTDAALQITNAKIAAGAGIVDTKLAQITTAGKVSGAALTLLGSVPSGSTALPIAAGGTGQTTRQAALNALSATSLSGTTGQGIVSDGTNMALGYPASLTIASAATGDLLWFNGTAWVRLAPGTADYALVSNGAGSAPGYEQVNLATGVQGVLPVANGGTGTTSLTDIGIPSQTGNSGKFLTTNGSAASWGTVASSGYSNVLFQWYGLFDEFTNDVYGSQRPDQSATSNSSSKTVVSVSTYQYRFVKGTTYRSVLVTKFIKTSGVSTVTVYARVYRDGNTGYVKCLIGNASGEVTATGAAGEWVTFTIDVSGLTNGTVYDVAVQLKSSHSGNSCFMSAVIAFGS